MHSVVIEKKITTRVIFQHFIHRDGLLSIALFPLRFVNLNTIICDAKCMNVIRGWQVIIVKLLKIECRKTKSRSTKLRRKKT